MATDTGPDLESGREAVEALMDDTCDIYGPELDRGQWAIDPDTLQLIPPAAAQPIYSGQCMIKDIASNSRGNVPSDEGGKPIMILSTEVGLPLYDSPAVPSGSVVICTSSRRNPFLVGASVLISDAVLKTMAIKYGLLGTRRVRVQ